MILTVIEQFAEHEVGAIISDAEQVAAILKSDLARFVVRTAPADEPSPPPAAATED